MDKDKFRTEIRAQIAVLDSVYISESNLGIFRNITSLPEFIAAPRVFTYLNIGREVDTSFLIEHCLETGKQVALPADLCDGKMNFALLDCSVSELPLGKFDIPIPHENAARLIPESGDIIIVPALCYDESFYRMGRGGGYYDRFLSSCPAFSIGLCREKLIVPEVPRDAFDMAVCCIITEKRIARPKMAPQK